MRMLCQPSDSETAEEMRNWKGGRGLRHPGGQRDLDPQPGVRRRALRTARLTEDDKKESQTVNGNKTAAEALSRRRNTTDTKLRPKPSPEGGTLLKQNCGRSPLPEEEHYRNILLTGGTGGR